MRYVAKHLVSRGQPVVTSVTGESRSTGSFNLPTNISRQTDADTSESGPCRSKIDQKQS